jgi:hypothetical protein
MEFINANIELFIIIGLIIGVLALGIGLIPYLQRKKYITIEGVKISTEMLQVLKILLIEMNFKNKNAKEQAVLILDIVEDILYYIENEMKIEDIEKRKEIAYQMVIEVLKDLEIEINENRKELIKISINEVLNLTN